MLNKEEKNIMLFVKFMEKWFVDGEVGKKKIKVVMEVFLVL